MKSLFCFSVLDDLVFRARLVYESTHMYYKRVKRAYKAMHCNDSCIPITIPGTVLMVSMFSCQKSGVLGTKLCQFRKFPCKPVKKHFGEVLLFMFGCDFYIIDCKKK